LKEPVSLSVSTIMRRSGDLTLRNTEKAEYRLDMMLA
jgi:hypothetical protein